LDVAYSGVEGGLLKRLAIRACPIFHMRSAKPSVQFVLRGAKTGGASLVRSGAGPRRGIHSPRFGRDSIAYQNATANRNLTDGDTVL
jgi:hypothetical protein